MVCIKESELRSLIRESYIDYIISEGRDVDSDIVAHILRLKDELNKRNLVCSTKYMKPDPNKRHRDFGLCTVRINTQIGRGKSLRPKTIYNAIIKSCDKLGLNKYFHINDNGYDGKYCETQLSLKPKYVQRYINQYKQPDML